MSRTILTASFVTAIAACTPYDPSLGATPFLCNANAPQCPDGYSCVDHTGMLVCETASAGGNGTIDAPGGSFACADDSVLEGATRNDTIATSSATPVESSRKSITYSGLAICPAGDKDNYRIDVTGSNQNLKATLVYDPVAQGGVVLSLAVLNAQGISVVNGAPMGANTAVANLPNLATANSPYYVQVAGPAAGENNYKLTLQITP